VGRVASIYSIVLSEMAQLREEFAQVCPEASVQIELLRPDKVYDAVIEGHADLGFISYPESRRDLAVIPWREERMTVAAQPSHRFAGRDSVEPADLQNELFGLEKQRFCEEIQVRIEIRRLGCAAFRKANFAGTIEPAGHARSVADPPGLQPTNGRSGRRDAYIPR
jgi:DNA-binding transcriptional LysR family regulator